MFPSIFFTLHRFQVDYLLIMDASRRRKVVVAVCGATGKQGGAVIDQLLLNNSKKQSSGIKFLIRALTRNVDSAAARALSDKDPKVIKLVKCELSSLESVTESLKGCDVVFGLTNYWDPATKSVPGLEVQQGKNLVDAAIQCGVKQFIWSSAPNAEALTKGLINPEHITGKALVADYCLSITRRVNEDSKKPAMSFTSLELGYFYSNVSEMNPPSCSLTGKIWLFADGLRDNVKMPWVHCNDISQAVLSVIQSGLETYDGKVIRLATRYLTVPEFLQLFERHGQATEHLVLKPSQLDRFAGKEVGNMFRYFNHCGFFGEGHNGNGIDFELVSRLIPNPTTPEDWIAHQLKNNLITPQGRGMGFALSMTYFEF
eukprot:TRINITY_DN694_c0_g1_i2.p1 TRINITY_DN694_c0_g1~~TRINITY_DN694_c0_g1_i2.p1  ORF type:complete len:372 (+),score=49.26 TRINITY_DN694_c0_g1_i2:451-1566(+)